MPARRMSGAAKSAAEPASGKREAILDAALDVFTANGFTAARLEDVAARAGVAKGTIYLYFRGKEDLFQELARAMLTPVVGNLAALRDAEVPVRALAGRIVELFYREIYSTRRKDVIRLMIAEGPRFPKLAEFYYREVLAPVFAVMRALLGRAAERGEIAPELARYPQIVAAAGLVAVVWNGLFDRFEPIDAKAMMKTHLDLVLAPRRAS